MLFKLLPLLGSVGFYRDCVYLGFHGVSERGVDKLVTLDRRLARKPLGHDDRLKMRSVSLDLDKRGRDALLYHFANPLGFHHSGELYTHISTFPRKGACAVHLEKIPGCLILNLSEKRGSNTQMKVKEIMSSPAISIGPDAPVKKVFEEIAGTGIHSVVVVEEEKPVGLVSVSDFLKLIVR